MKRILNEIRKIIDENMVLYLPHVKSGDLENDGAIFYMNAQNGTEFDWFVNDRFPFFMVFYNDKDNLGAVKLVLCNTGEVQIYLYDEKGKKLVKMVKEHLDIDKIDMLKLAAVLTREADDKKIWGGNIDNIHTDIEITDDELREFCGREKDHAVMKNRMNICSLSAVVSKKIIEEGWKVGYMERNEPRDKDDSGWFFASGNEDDEYLSDSKNLMLLVVGMVWQRLDRDIFRYIDMPAGTKLIRISPNEFEIDKNNKEIYLAKRE
ncbi:DUF2185 domain-containing protein [Clostridium sp. MCC353]|uniref:immunity protein Imm33 domain-containing protein n=1 Tax=Clostridium sp. MCC353 TaxID=2592646 RepID=UPI001C02AF2F|nr:DUF2185 domain-containing protein [Clostridium sp. MCC353]MBT9775260.1 DUF2185 domain-containing protein [Clostridium sp. MCC353]